MVARPGHIQSVFNAGEIGSRFDARVDSKYYNAGLSRAENLEILAQGGFTLRPGFRHIGDVAASAARLVNFKATNGNVYDLVWNAAQIEVWGATARLHQFGHPYTAAEMAEFLWAQDQDTLLAFHENKAPWRALHGGPTTWATGAFPLNDIPNYDYGAGYTNGVPAEWELELIGFDTGTPLSDGIIFVVTINNQDTVGIRAVSTAPPSGATPDMVQIASRIQAAILNLPNVAAGATCVVTSSVSPFRCKIVFGGDDNAGDGWAVSVRVINKSDAAVLSNRTIAGVEAGEPLISNTRGWPRCGRFYQQRLLLGGFKSLKSAWMASASGSYSNFDTRLDTADGPFFVILTLPGGEVIENIVDNQFLLIMTSERNYWVAGSANGLSKTAPPKHVPATDHGVAAHVPVVDNEGAAIYIHKSGDFLGEMRYTDIDGNYVAQDLSLLAYHLIDDARDLAIKRKEGLQSANTCAILNKSGELRLCYLLREQELTGFSRVATDGVFKAISVNGRNELAAITERPRGAGVKRALERLEPGLLLDAAVDRRFTAPACLIGGLAMHEGQEVWCIGDGDVFGPFIVQGGEIDLPKKVLKATIGRWRPPRAATLPVSRMVAQDIWLQGKARIHSVQVFVEDTTSLAIEANGRIYDQDLRRWGGLADVPELDAGYTGLVTVRGLGGYADAPTIAITQTRPGRLTVRSVTLEAST